METAIREELVKKFDDDAYLGTKSLTRRIQETVVSNLVNWSSVFENSEDLQEYYDSLKEFMDDIAIGAKKAIDGALKILYSAGWMALGGKDPLAIFKEWLADIIEGNNLKKSGIVLIWDEFTNYVKRNLTNDDVLQPLSESCKEQPFFMLLIVHMAPDILNANDPDYKRIMDRFHTLEFHINENAAFEFISQSIKVRPEVETQWHDEKSKLMNSIKSELDVFDALDQRRRPSELVQRLCPLHPMTLSLLTIVAQNFGSSQRTLFQFMKDKSELEENVGFTWYINNFGPEKWKWMTPDFLWDYFFARDRYSTEFSGNAQEAYENFERHKLRISNIGDMENLRVFKAAMLLIASVSHSLLNRRGRQTNSITATKETLCRCFAGQMKKSVVEECIATLVEIKALSLDFTFNRDNPDLQTPLLRERPMREPISRSVLLSKENGGVFARALEKKLWDTTRPSNNRMYILVCDAESNAIRARIADIKREIGSNPYKFGLLGIVISEPRQYSDMQEQVKKLAADGLENHFAVCLVKTPLTGEIIKKWNDANASFEDARKSSKGGERDNYQARMNFVIEDWADNATKDTLLAMCGEKICQARGSAELTRTLENEVIFKLVFPAAPELLSSTTTVFKPCSDKTILSGIRREPGNSQINSISSVLMGLIGNSAELKELTKLTGDIKSRVIARLAEYLLAKLPDDQDERQNAVSLEDLWLELQGEPFGYYNSIICGYTLGYLMTSYARSDFTWDRGDNNPAPLDEVTLAQMLSDMSKSRTQGHYLSSGSGAWRAFKPYAKGIFKLNDNEIANESEGRKFMAKYCIERGAPFWILKFLPREDFGGADMKRTADEICDKISEFIASSGNQDSLLNDIEAKFHDHGKLREALTSLYAARNKIGEAFSVFVKAKCPELEKLREKLSLTGNDMLQGVRSVMQRDVYTWEESLLSEKLDELCLEYRVTTALNKVLDLEARGKKEKDLITLCNSLKNAFNHMKVPGIVIESMNFDWVPAMRILHELADGVWTRLGVDEKRACAEQMESTNARNAWSNISFSTPILKKYINEKLAYRCTDQEIESIALSLNYAPFEQQEQQFRVNLESLLDDIEYNRNLSRIRELWRECSGFESVKAWCNHYAMPVQWFDDDELREHAKLINDIQENKTVDGDALDAAVRFFTGNSCAIAALHDEVRITKCFFEHIGESYKSVFESDQERATIIGRLKTDRTLGHDVHSWANKLTAIRAVLNDYVRDIYLKRVLELLTVMPSDELREKAGELFKQHPELCGEFLQKS